MIDIKRFLPNTLKEAVADIKKQLEQLELDYGWQNINTTSRQKYLRKQVAKSENGGGI